MTIEVPLAPNHPSWDRQPAESFTSVLPSSTIRLRVEKKELSIPELPLFVEARSHALNDPLKAAIIDKSKDQSFTFNQLLNDVAALKGDIQQYLYSTRNSTSPTSEEEPRVAFLTPSGYDYVVTQWAIWAAGGICVPLCMAFILSSLCRR